MKKLLLAICLVFITSTASADYWRQDASLLPGTYMLVHDNATATAQLDYLQAIAREKGVVNPNPMGIISLGDCYVFVVGVGGENAGGLAEYLNVEPLTSPDKNPMLFKKDKIGWHQIPLPCKWTLGEVGT